MNLPTVTIYSDGGANPNPGPGGWGALLIFADGTQRELFGGEADTTNNRMELSAACEALEALTTSHEVIFYVDSQYVQKGITEWIKGWIKKNWKDVKNPELWQRLHAATQRHRISWKWVKGHSGNRHNDRVDQLATAGRAKVLGEKVDLSPIDSAVSAPPAATAAHFDCTIYTAVDYDKKGRFGGWSAILVTDRGTTELSGSQSNTTDYHLALLAVRSAFEQLPERGSILVYTPSENVQKGASQWIKGWRNNGWKNSKNELIAHQALWQALDPILQARTISWKFAVGSNPTADQIAARARQKAAT